VKPFDTSIIDGHDDGDCRVTFRAVPVSDGSKELVGVEMEGVKFVLEIRKRDDFYLIRPDKITRPLDVNLIKKVLGSMRRALEIEVINSNIELSPYRPPVASLYDKKIEDFEEVEFPYDRVAVEVGFGSGRHLLHQAKEHPDRLHIGLEIHTPSAQQVLRQISIVGLENVWVVNYDARLLIEMLPSNVCEAIFVHFPVPWDKKPHRRVIGEKFLEESMRVLSPGGYLELRTDSEKYYRYALEVFSSPEKISFLVEKNRDLPVVSKYEARWKRMNKNIYNITVHSTEISEEKVMREDFAFERKASFEKLESLPKESKVYGGCFVKFGDYMVMSDGTGGVVECSFGSFDRPERRYLFVSADGNISYFPGRPVRTSANIEAHKRIGGWIYV
jgi:tRNA (guanine-N7-)-methyltransferase